jgi:formamidopyrimidine-DNA glycosylase
MPELPEVEITRLGFADRIAGARITAVRQGKPLRWPLGCAPADLVGQTVCGVRRRGKYLLLDLSQGLLLFHLGMSGSMRFDDQAMPEAGPHDHFDLCTSQGQLRLHDPRRFGAAVFAPSEAHPVAQKLLGKLGVEPLTAAFEPAMFHAGLKTRQTAIKQVLLAGDLVVGVGNIYACEALFMAGIRPDTPARRMSRARASRLHQAIQDVLRKALDSGGSTLRDFSNIRGEHGHFQLQVYVYGRAGEPCRVCAHPVRLLRQGQRSSFYCATCQKA